MSETKTKIKTAANEIHLIILGENVPERQLVMNHMVHNLETEVNELQSREPYASENIIADVICPDTMEQILQCVKVPSGNNLEFPEHIAYIVIRDKHESVVENILAVIAYELPVTLYVYRTNADNMLTTSRVSGIPIGTVCGLERHHAIIRTCYDKAIACANTTICDNTTDGLAYNQIYVIPVDDNKFEDEELLHSFQSQLMTMTDELSSKVPALRNTEFSSMAGTLNSFIRGRWLVSLIANSTASGNNDKEIEHVSYVIIRNSDLDEFKQILLALAMLAPVSVHYFTVLQDPHTLEYSEGLNDIGYNQMLDSYNPVLCGIYDKVFIPETNYWQPLIQEFVK